MFDRQIQKHTQKPLQYIAKLFLKFISPNHMTFIGFSFGVLMCISIIIDQYLIVDLPTLLLAISIPIAIIFCLLLMSYNNQLRKNQATCKVPNYPNEALGLVVKIGNLLGDVINILMALKGRKRPKEVREKISKVCVRGSNDSKWMFGNSNFS